MSNHPIQPQPERRRFLRFGAALGGFLTGCKTSRVEEPAEPSSLGKPLSEHGARSPFEKTGRLPGPGKNPEIGSSKTPLQDCYGILTPASLHFERHHSGVPHIDPAAHKLLLHGLVDRPLMLTMADIHRLPAVSRIHFIECSGNSRSEWGPKTAPDAQKAHGLVSCSEWTGVPLSIVLAEAGVKAGASWIVAEGADACHMQRSIPLKKALDDALLVFGQNGEAIRPEQGYPLRLLIPGWEGNTSVKWVRRIKLVDQPSMTKDETSKYTDLMADGTARQFTFEMDAKSVITFPSGGQKLAGPGFCEISGLAWSGRGRIERVEISTDGGRTWVNAALDEPRLRIAFTRFRLPWKWEGQEVILQSRCTDETGYVQPSREALLEARGANSDYHNNCITAWKISPGGGVTNV
ncbi:MAG TPA: sulfite dehydrogenase [Bryobacteraceae bacterium]|nr:sulfite dehydrogenase [Bryobacteraceae bacterium]